MSRIDKQRESTQNREMAECVTWRAELICSKKKEFGDENFQRLVTDCINEVWLEARRIESTEISILYDHDRTDFSSVLASRRVRWMELRNEL